MVESRNRCSMSASPRIAVAISSQTPDSRQREKRTYVRPVPELGRQVTPGTAGAHDPKDGFNEPPIVPSRATRITRFAGQQVFNAFPLVIAQHPSIHPDSVQKSGYDHISTTVNSPSPCH
jgi:hypothetical protein